MTYQQRLNVKPNQTASGYLFLGIRHVTATQTARMEVMNSYVAQLTAVSITFEPK